ncbi:U-box domain-containing protein 35-like isoform X2 [Magnolia sinica]|uniref:U-box domain-containing protein 35-like isoform X2 n=1 Tax=Magnolia sinica TaxID=86752 RepID=UPI0026593C01|nr:U-box domain-containing protein 35-like isoform X2 [Magnolia sinica]
MEVREVEGRSLQPPSVSTVAVAVNGKNNCKSAVKWALGKFVPEGRVQFKLLHVRARITMVPTAMGNYLPISQVRDEVASAYKKEVEWRTTAMLLPYKQMCSQKQVEAEAVVIEADDVADAISEEIAKFSINTLVIGASSRSMLARKLRGRDVCSRISERVPSFCTVYVVSKGRLSSVRASTSETNESARDERSDSNLSTNSCLSSTSSTQTECTNTTPSVNFSHFRSSSLPDQRYQALLTINQAVVNKRASPDDTHHSKSLSVSTEEEVMSSNSSFSDFQYGGSMESSYRSFQTDSQSCYSDQASTSDLPTDSPLPGSQVDISFELERLRIELRHVRGMYTMAQNEKTDAARQVNELSRRRAEEIIKLKEIHDREAKARELASLEKERSEAVKWEAEVVMECAEREVMRRIVAETKAARDAEEKQKLEKALVCSDQQYKKFTWEEIVSATSSFSDSLRIGMGGYGMVYKCNLQHTMAAVKVLHSNEGHRTKQFQQELEILSRMRHPHLLLLLGACPDRGCLVYEYMENGSLDDRLLCINNKPPIPWFDRYRIAWEVASALVFLHNSKPEPIVHRDLKPANILLDHNLVSKIGDIGLSTLLPLADSSLSAMYKDTAPAGTFCYIDPEYQRTGLVSVKSDVYAFGMVILQLLTAKSPLGLTDVVETALEEGRLMDVLDRQGGEWPTEETQELAALGLNCTELRRRDRPDLQDQILPMLERLKGLADRARNPASSVMSIPPSHFICPILQDVMDDPCVAADGYTYERRAIDLWLSMNDKSPMTNSPLPHKYLVPNYTLISAIMEWKSKNQLHLPCDS